MRVVLRRSVECSDDRYNIAQTKRDLGSGTEFELLLARSDLNTDIAEVLRQEVVVNSAKLDLIRILDLRSEEHTSELQSRGHLVCRLLLEKKKTHNEQTLSDT